MAQAELRRQMHMQEVEKKIKLLQMNWFIKNYHEEANDDGPRPTAPSSVHTTRLIDEIREMRAEIRYINAKLDEYQREINDKRTANKPSRPSPPLLETNVSYMYRVPSDVKIQLYTGNNTIIIDTFERPFFSFSLPCDIRNVRRANVETRISLKKKRCENRLKTYFSGHT